MKALIAMSGGVDSSVAAKLMQDAGYDCIGCTMKLYNNPDAGCSSKTCCSLSDVEDARSVAARLHRRRTSRLCACLPTWCSSPLGKTSRVRRSRRRACRPIAPTSKPTMA